MTTGLLDLRDGSLDPTPQQEEYHPLYCTIKRNMGWGSISTWMTLKIDFLSGTLCNSTLENTCAQGNTNMQSVYNKWRQCLVSICWQTAFSSARPVSQDSWLENSTILKLKISDFSIHFFPWGKLTGLLNFGPISFHGYQAYYLEVDYDPLQNLDNLHLNLVVFEVSSRK